MNKLAAVLASLVASSVVTLSPRSPAQEPQPATANGDVNADGKRDIADAIYLLDWLFLGGPGPAGLDPPPDLLARISELEAALAAIEADDERSAEKIATLEAALGAIQARTLSVPAGFAALGVNGRGYEEYRHDATGIVFVLLPGGRFTMGSPEDECERDSDEGPAHPVFLSPFLLAKREVSQAEWRVVMGTDPSSFKGDELPVEDVSWHDAKAFCDQAGLSLPTEAQWEYACRAGTATPFSFGEEIALEQVNFSGLSYCGGPNRRGRGKTTPAGSLEPNAFGLHDLHGNVWEWCEDVYDRFFYGQPAAYGPDPVNAAGSGGRLVRGGGWGYFAGMCRSAVRYNGIPTHSDHLIGFRPARRLEE